MLHLDSIADLRTACDDARARGSRVGLVPTMGYLHDGHRSLIRAARTETDFVVVTIFVNPLQFGPAEDLDRYPRDLTGDLEQCRTEGVDAVFSPAASEMYPQGAPLTTVHVAGLTDVLCGTARPTHFDGVTTVVAKLFAITGPCRAYFGRKDAQQFAVIARMTSDLDLPIEVVGCPLVREPDGLAMSSRNAYLTPEQRRAALVLSRSLERAARAAVEGERDTGTLVALVRATIATEPMVALEYAEARDAHTLATVDDLAGDVLLAVAARVGPTRLIDNVMISVHDSELQVDLGSEAARRRGSGAGTTGSRERSVKRTMMKSKIHRAKVTGANLDYVGSITLDRELMARADIREYEQVALLDIDNGARFETYAMEGDSGDVILNGAAARLVQPGDRVIVITYGVYDEAELREYAPLIVHVDDTNTPIEVDDAVRRAGSNLMWIGEHSATNGSRNLG